MEVHHHPEVGKKNFKEYLLEGLMIFLAVTMGFFAESLRENINANDKEKEYIVSFENNLEKDKAGLNDIILENKKKIEGLDSLLALANKNMADPASRKMVYMYASAISNTSVFISNDATMTQLKNSGGLQFIKHGNIADSISKYDQEVRGIYAAEAPYTRYTNDATEAMTDLLIFNLKNHTARLSKSAAQPYPLLSLDPERIQVFFNKVMLERGWTQNYIGNLQERLPYTTKLIALLKQEYDLN
jgi:hypothetical protein